MSDYLEMLPVRRNQFQGIYDVKIFVYFLEIFQDMDLYSFNKKENIACWIMYLLFR